VEYLQQIIRTRNEEIRRRDHLLAAALERIPAIEAPQEAAPDPRGGRETAAEEPSKGDVPLEQEKEEDRRSWWQRWFGA
jgi:hypothetical protein